MDKNTEFFWQRPLDGNGYRTELRTDTQHKRDVLCLVPNDGVRFGLYNPLVQYPTLFREFAETPPTTEGVLTFANSHGLLGDVHRVSVYTGQAGTVPTFESVDGWESSIESMADSVELWELARTENASRLAELLKWDMVDGAGRVTYCHRPDRLKKMGAILKHKSVKNPIWEYLYEIKTDGTDVSGGWYQGTPIPVFQVGELVRPAKFFVHRWINQAMRKHVHAKLCWDREKDRVELLDTPFDLLGAMYLQFAWSVATNREFRKCAMCHRWIEIQPPETRTTRLTCSPSCRNKLYRQRMELAAELHQNGKKVGEIAKQLNADAATVKGWLDAAEKIRKKKSHLEEKKREIISRRKKKFGEMRENLGQL